MIALLLYIYDLIRTVALQGVRVSDFYEGQVGKRAKTRKCPIFSEYREVISQICPRALPVHSFYLKSKQKNEKTVF